MRGVSDEDIKGRVTKAIIRSGHVDFADRVQVDVQHGRVVLSGTVRSATEKAMAGSAAALVPGVREVLNGLTVSTDGTIHDDELARAAQEALAGSDSLAVRGVGARVEDGVAYLEGEVPTVAQEEEAKRLAGAVKGMEDVVSQLVVGEKAPLEGVLPADDAALASFAAGALSEAGIDLREEQLWAEEGIVHVRAKVRSKEDGQRAIQVLESVPGVRAVRAHFVVRRSETSEDPDEALIARVIHAFRDDGRVSPVQVQLTARDGVVTLSGQVDSIDDQNAAVEVAQRVPGVRQVINRLIITDRTSTRSDDKGLRL